MRRAVSSAYYAVFHLLISETVAYWRLDASRDALARMFEHRTMARASDRVLDSRLFPFVDESPIAVESLKIVATNFCRLQDQRHKADYDNATYWTYTEAKEEVAVAEKTFSIWQSIKDEKIAQDYLVSLLIKPRG